MLNAFKGSGCAKNASWKQISNIKIATEKVILQKTEDDETAGLYFCKNLFDPSL